eukprot:TRINITY_DN4462_c0_g1_i1.p1 TRINITY_DN4462_c0_g1~~TRINITY_DN4462_c0_g1_i1.p1  ORF type:complete len:851 (+),score=291.72 TRINITY_DN4462_c0_g1_i1:75-2627(+)
MAARGGRAGGAEGDAGAPQPLPSLEKYSVRTMRTSTRVTVMKRFLAFYDRSRPFEARQSWKKAAQSVQALQRLSKVLPKQRPLAADMVVVTGHEHGLLQVRNFDTGEVIGRGKHYNESTVTCIQVSNSYVYTAVEHRVQKGRASLAASSSDHCDIFVWDMTNLNEIAQTLEGHEDRVTCLAVPPWNELTPVSGSLDKTIMIWNIPSGRKPVHILKGHTMMVKHLLLSRESIFSASSDASIRVWDWEGQAKATYEKVHSGPIFFFSFGCTPESIISACGGGYVRESVLDECGLKMLWTNKAAKGQILDVAFDTKYVASASAEAAYINFYVRSQRDNRKLPLPDQATVRTLEIDPSRQCLLTGADDGVIAVWNYDGVEDGKVPAQVLRVPAHSCAITSIILDQDPSGAWERILTCSGDNTVHVIDFMKDRNSRTHPLKKPVQHMVTIERTGSVVTTHGNEGWVWNSHTKEHKASYGADRQWGYMRGHHDALVGLRYSAEEQKMITLSEDGQLRTWEVSFYDEEDMQFEELIKPVDVMDMKHPSKHLGECFGQAIGVCMGKAHYTHGVVSVVNYAAMETMAHFITHEPPTAISFVGVPNEEITQVICQMPDHDIVLHELNGKVIQSVAPPPQGLPKYLPLIPYRTWSNLKYTPPQEVVLLARADLVKEVTVILDGAKVVHDVRADWGLRCGGTITCMEHVMQGGMHCMIGLDNGKFKAIDKFGELLHTIEWDGSTVHNLADRDAPPHRSSERRRTSGANSAGTSEAAPATCLYVCRHQRYAVLGFADGCVHLWDTTGLRNTRRWYPHGEEAITFVRIVGTRVITACRHALRFDTLDAREDHVATPEQRGPDAA